MNVQPTVEGDLTSIERFMMSAEGNVAAFSWSTQAFTQCLAKTERSGYQVNNTFVYGGVVSAPFFVATGGAGACDVRRKQGFTKVTCDNVSNITHQDLRY